MKSNLLTDKIESEILSLFIPLDKRWTKCLTVLAKSGDCGGARSAWRRGRGGSW
jgi:hypothetical protein